MSTDKINEEEVKTEEKKEETPVEEKAEKKAEPKKEKKAKKESKKEDSVKEAAEKAIKAEQEKYMRLAAEYTTSANAVRKSAKHSMLISRPTHCSSSCRFMIILSVHSSRRPPMKLTARALR